jgi:probable rRNA maturation factor
MKKNNSQLQFANFPKDKTPLLEKAALLTLKSEKIKKYEINFIMVSDAEIKKLNAKFRKVRRITDVISFLVSEEFFIGDIYISKGRTQKNAALYSNAWGKELAYLVIHGILHLCGYTDYDPENKAKMFAKQDKIFKCLPS